MKEDKAARKFAAGLMAHIASDLGLSKTVVTESHWDDRKPYGKPYMVLKSTTVPMHRFDENVRCILSNLEPQDAVNLKPIRHPSENDTDAILATSHAIIFDGWGGVTEENLVRFYVINATRTVAIAIVDGVASCMMLNEYRRIDPTDGEKGFLCEQMVETTEEDELFFKRVESLVKEYELIDPPVEKSYKKPVWCITHDGRTDCCITIREYRAVMETIARSCSQRKDISVVRRMMMITERRGRKVFAEI